MRSRFLVVFAVVAMTWPAALKAERLWTVHHGQTVITLDQAALDRLHLSVGAVDSQNDPGAPGRIVVEATPDDQQILVTGDAENDAVATLTSGVVHHKAELILTSSSGRLVVNDLLIGDSLDSERTADAGAHLLTQPSTTVFDQEGGTLAIESESIVISAALAQSIGMASAEGESIGQADTLVYLVYVSGEPLEPRHGGSNLICTNPSAGPDVIVGDLNGISNYTQVGGIDAFSIGTTSCNIGNALLLWQSGNVNHPVIPQNMYRLKTVSGSARFEQVGQSWMKHAFTALSQNLCCTCSSGGGGSTLGIGCSDPYTSGRNGSQVTTTGGLGPRFEVNAHAGAITFPYTFRGVGTMGGGSDPSTISRRLQVLVSDVDPAQNSGAVYFGEAQYVTPDDAANRNQNNNCSYRTCTFTVSSGDSTATITGATVRQKAAIQAWKTADPTVTETTIDTPEATPSGQPTNTTGRCILSAKATSLGGGVYHYEYALFNMNSDRGISSVAVPVSASLSVSNIGFHDVPYHSGDGFGTAQGNLKNIDGTNWPGSFAGGNVEWDVIPLVSPADPRNTNYLHWGNLYNYRFDCNSPPTTGNVTLGFWKAVTGQPNSMTAATVVPTLVICDPPVIDPIAPQSATCGSAFSSSAPSASGSGPFTWSIVAGLQPGMSMDASTGVASWPSPVPSASDYTLKVMAASQCSAAVDVENMTISVPFGATPAIDPVTPAAAICDVPYTSNAPTTTGTAPFSWSISGAPAGMTIDSATGIISWPNPALSPTPYNVTVQCTDSCAAGPGSVAFSLSVLLGDLNGDGVVDDLDVDPLVDIMLGVSATPPCAADINGDGFVDGLDAQAMVDLLGV